MDEQLRKQNTDCVYFLASPLTCKKGMECEYRHSDSARLNPRDCWYWFNAKCLNSRCRFRHQPLEKHTKEPLEQVSSYRTSVSVNKTSVSCYFYYNGVCNKGDSCSFSHGFNGNAPSTTSAKMPSTVTTNAALRTGKVAESAEAHVSPPKTAPKIAVNLKLLYKKDPVLQSVTKNLISQGEIVLVDVSSGDEGAAHEYNASSPRAIDNTENGSSVFSDQNPLKQVDDDHDESEERLESSPGFDVLVDNMSDNMVYEDEDGEENLPLHDKENRELTNHLGYHFEDPLEYDHRYPDKLLHEADMYDSFDSADSLPVFDDEILNSGYSRSRMHDSMMFRKRKLLPTDSKNNGLRGIDLRERLAKRRLVDGNWFISRSSRSHASPYLRGQSQERYRRRSTSKHPRGWLASEVGMNAIRSSESSRSVPNFRHNFHAERHSVYGSNRPNLLFKGRRHDDKKFLSSTEVARDLYRKNRMFSQTSTGFTGPKTYAQIKEEKSKAGKTADRNSRRMDSGEFDGPKPLSEILKDKKRLSSVIETNNDGGN